MEVIDNRVKQLEQELAAAKQELHQLKSILSLVPGHIYWKDSNGVILGCNLEQAKMAGCDTQEQVIGTTDYDYFSQEEAEILKANDKEVMRTGRPLIKEEHLKFPNSDNRIFLTKKMPLYSMSTKKVVGIIGISMDITAQKQAEEYKSQQEDTEKLQELKDYYEHIISKIPGHVYWIDTNNVYLGCNDEQAVDAGLTNRKEIVGKTNKDMIWKQHAEELDTINLSVMQTGKAHTIEEDCLFTGGEGIWFSKKVPLYNNTNEVIGLLGISIDISDRKEAERLAVENARIEKEREEAQKYAERMKTLASNISHEHKTPLSGIKLTVQIIQKLFPKLVTGYTAATAANLIDEPLSTEQINSVTELFNKALTQINRATTMVSIQLYNMQHDKFQTKYFKTSSIADTVNEALAHYPFTEGERDVTHENLTDTFPFHGDPLLLQHVIWNLLKNALHFIREEDKGEIAIWLESDDEFNKLHFKDTAKGMSPEETNLIFNAFYSKRSGGSGLGLTFCNSVMEAFGGKIQCDAKEGHFTEFTLCFPKIKNIKKS
jgi:PAS domain S-box-containing protein